MPVQQTAASFREKLQRNSNMQPRVGECFREDTTWSQLHGCSEGDGSISQDIH